MDIKVNLQNITDHDDPDTLFLICRHGSGRTGS